MLDLALFGFVMVFFAIGLRRPFLWVLAYCYIDILAPQKIGWSITSALPISLIAFCAAFAGWLLTDTKKGTRFTFRQFLLCLLLVYCFWTTRTADFPVEALEKWGWVWKALVFAIFLPLTLFTRLRIEGAALIMMLTAGAIIISAGMKTALGGGGYASLYFFVNDNSGMYESSTLLLWLWIHALGLWQMEWVRRRWRTRGEEAAGEGQWQAPLASALQVAQIIYLVGSLFQGIAYQPFVLMLIGVQIALDVLQTARFARATGSPRGMAAHIAPRDWRCRSGTGGRVALGRRMRHEAAVSQ